MRHDHVAAGGQGRDQPGNDPVRVILIGHKVQDRDQHQRYRPGKVKSAPYRGITEDLVRLAQVGVDVGGGTLGRAVEQGGGVREHQRVVVDIDNPRIRCDPLRDLVHVVGHRQADADVKELAHAGLHGQEGYRPAQEGTVFSDGGPDGGKDGGNLVAGFPVGDEVVLTAEPVVVPAPRSRHRCVDL